MGVKANKLSQVERVAHWLSVHCRDVDTAGPAFQEFRAAYIAREEEPRTPLSAPFLIHSVGHSGSVWLAFLMQVCDPSHVICLHSHETVHAWIANGHPFTHHRDWNDPSRIVDRVPGLPSAIQGLRMLRPEFPAHIEHLLQHYSRVGYSLPCNKAIHQAIVDCAARAYPEAPVLGCIRNGIRVVRSMVATSRRMERDHDSGVHAFDTSTLRSDPLFSPLADPWSELAARFPGDLRFLRGCMSWAAGVGAARRLRGTLGPRRVRLVRLEDITTSVEAAVDTAAFLGDVSPSCPVVAAGVRLAQSNDVNRKVIDDASLVEVWSGWSLAERTIFRELCADGMAEWDYPMHILKL